MEDEKSKDYKNRVGPLLNVEKYKYHTKKPYIAAAKSLANEIQRVATKRKEIRLMNLSGSETRAKYIEEGVNQVFHDFSKEKYQYVRSFIRRNEREKS